MGALNLNVGKSAFTDAGKATSSADTELQTIMKDLAAVPDPMKGKTAGDFWEAFKKIMNRTSDTVAGLQKALVSIGDGQHQLGIDISSGEQQQGSDATTMETKADWDSATFRNRT